MSRELFDAIRTIKGSALTQADVDLVNDALSGFAKPNRRSISQAGLEAIKKHEGLRLTAYPDPGSGGEPWTIGYGRAHGVKKGQTITEAQAEQFLREDVKRFEDAVNLMAPKTTQGQFDALVSFAFNLGEGNLRESTLLRLHNAGDYQGASQQFQRWNKASGRVLPGLTKRRGDEALLYLS